MSQQDLTELFKQYGEIISCKLELGPDNKSRGFGYVQFAKAENASAAISKLSGSNVQGKVLNLTVLTKRTDREETVDNFSNLYVSNIPSDWNDGKLQEIFKPFGEIQSIRVQAEKGCGFVKFNSHDSAMRAIDALDKKYEVGGKTLFV